MDDKIHFAGAVEADSWQASDEIFERHLGWILQHAAEGIRDERAKQLKLLEETK